ncbi:MYG1 family protein [Candidatus Pacearchaeota archaeon]|nr:MYG1 family protein [Candidatus Pacearchaeota archaeon]
MKTVAVHDGTFHADEVLAVAILRLLYPKIKIIRTRDPEKFNKADFRVDVGRRYNPKTGDFDHHQNEFNEKRKNKIPYASAGLVWKHFGMKLVNSKEGFDYIEEKIIQLLDAEDNGVQTYSNEIVHPYTLGNVIVSFNPNWQKRNSDKDKLFEKSVLFTKNLLKREIDFANGMIKANKIIKEAISKSNGEYIVLDHLIPWKKTVITKSNIKFVVHKQSDGNWFASAVPVKENSFESRKLFPRKWAGLEGKELTQITGVEDSIFCHKNLFAAVAKSKEGVIKLVEMALKEKKS